MKRIVCVKWKDATEHEGNIKEGEKEPLTLFVTYGEFVGTYKDDEGIPYLVQCYKRALKGAENDDEWICIPVSDVLELKDMEEVPITKQ